MKPTEYSDLPSELIDKIFDALWIRRPSPWYITHDQREIFRNCLPVSTDFRHRILSRFCRYVHLEDDDDHGVVRLRELIFRRHDSRLGGIARYIKHFSLHIILSSQRRDGAVSGFGMLPQIMRDSDLAAIIAGLHGQDFGVTDFTLSLEAKPNAHRVPWSTLPPNIRYAFQSLLHSPYLTRLHLRNLAVPQSIISGSFLQELVLEQFPRHLTGAIPPHDVQELNLVPAVLPLPSLMTLCTDYSYERYSTPLPAAMVDKLRIYRELPNRFSSSKRTWEIIGLSASSLTEICIDHTGEVVKPPKAFNLGSVHNLKSFRYSRRFPEGCHFDESNDLTPSILFQLFHVTEPMEDLESIDIKINIDLDLKTNLETDFEFLDNYFLHAHREWGLLDADLANASRFPRLIQVGIKIKLNTPYDVEEQAFIEKINDNLKSSFPRVLARKTISFQPITKVKLGWHILGAGVMEY